MQLKCAWATKSMMLQKYHDNGWGKPVFDDQELFKNLAIQIMQSGLDFRIVLSKLEAIEAAFDTFTIKSVAEYDEEKITRLLECPTIIKNERKIRAIIHNAKMINQMAERRISFSDFLWAQVEFVPIDMHQRNNVKLMGIHPIAQRICKSMREEDFHFIGPKNISFFLQASGIINAHWINCAQYRRLKI